MPSTVAGVRGKFALHVRLEQVCRGVHSLTVVRTRLDFKLSDVVSVVHAADFPSGS